MSKEEIKELFNKYDVKNLKDKHGQSECYFCKNIRHRYSLTWTSFLYEYKEHYYCYDCLLSILLQQENSQLKEQVQCLIKQRDDTNKSAVETIEKYQVENSQLKEDYNKVVHEATEFESKVYELQERIEKAIEFINIYTNRINLEAFDCLKLMYKIEEILKGDKE